MKFSYTLLQDFITAKLPTAEKLAELLTMHSFEVEASEPFGKDFVLDIAVPANRADCFSHIGIAREIAAIIKSKIKNQKSKIQIKNQKLKTEDFITIEVKDKNDCQRYTARVVANVKVGPSPKWMQERLNACGIQSINNVVDVANYVMLETGQPLHAFDLEKISAMGNKKSKIKNQNDKSELKKIIVRRGKKGEHIVSLDNKTYDLDEDILIIADEKEPLAIAGIKGGKKAEIDEKTKTVVWESANFNPLVIRRGSRKLGLKTDASLRFEHGLDPNLTEFAVNRAADLTSLLAQGDVAKSVADFYPQKAVPKRIRGEIEYVERLIGVKIPEREIKNMFVRLGIEIQSWTRKSFVVVVPTFRLDLVLQEDLIEEIARLYGYEKIPASFPRSTLIPPKRNDDIFWEFVAKNALKEAGLTEVYNYSFVSEEDAKIFGDNYWINIGEVENPVSSDYKYLRPSLLINLLKNIKLNQKRFSDIKIFELGKVFDGKNVEHRMLSGVMTGDAFYSAKGILDTLFQAMGISGIWYDEYEPSPEETPFAWWEERKSAEVKTEEGKEIGYLGEISREILGDLDVEGKVVAFDIDFEKLQALATEEQIYRPVSKYPSAMRDIAILVSPFTKVEDVLNVIETAGGRLVRDVDLFDIYEGEELPEGKKNFAFHIAYQAEDHTLTSEEIDAVHQRIIAALEENEEWEVRK